MNILTMNKIHVTESMKDADMRKIRLGNGITLQFTSKRQSLYFMAETNRFLTKV